jgi:heptosyltransferase III
MKEFNNKKILLIRNDNVGDLICTTPAIEALRKKYPNNQIDIVVNSYNYSAIDKNPFVNKIYCYTKPKHKKSFLNKIKAAIGKLKILINIMKEKYDVVIVFRSDYSKSAELFSNITNAKYKIGVKNPKGKDNFNIHIPVNNKKHEVEFCFDCLSELGISYENENTFFYVPESFSNKYIKYNDFTLFHISSRREANKYDIQKFKEVIDSLGRGNILITAEPDDFEKAKNLDDITDATFIQTSSLLDLAGLIKNVKLFVTLDGGAMHVAPALGIKTVSISGETNMDKWYPWGYRDLVIQTKSKIANDVKKDQIIEKIKMINEYN